MPFSKIPKSEYFIKSGGGNGPMMPGNRRKACGANSGGAIAPADKA